MSGNEEALERLKAALQREIKQEELLNLRNIETYKAQLLVHQSAINLLGNYSTLFLRSLVTLNAGSIIGLLTYEGNLSAKNAEYAHQIALKSMHSIGTFVIGLIMALLSTGLSMAGQAAFIKKDDKDFSTRIGRYAGITGLFCSIASLGAFSIGALSVARALAHTIP